jgi:hypothetical protein
MADTPINDIKTSKKKRVLKPDIGAEITKGKKGKVTAVGAPFPNVNTSFTGRRIDVKLLEQTARAPPVARSLWQLQLIAFPWFEFNIIPPSSQSEDEQDEDEIKELKIKLEELDRSIGTNILCAQAMYDVVTYGSAIFEITWKDSEDGYIVPDVVQRLPAQSFRQAPAGAIGDRNKYVVGNILKGLVFNKVDKIYEYWQLQNPYGSTGVPVQIPSEQLIHIKDARSSYVDGEPYLAGITSTIAQLEFVRKRVMQTVTRIGTPKQIATVGIPPSYMKALEANGLPMPVTSAVPGGSSTPADVMLTDLWDMARVLVENQNSDIAVAVPEGIKLEWERPSIPFNPTEIDSYLVKEAISHIFPRDILEVASQAISTSSAPLLELLKMMVQGWQSLCSIKFETELWNKFLVLNGYDGYRITLDWTPLLPEDTDKTHTRTIKLFEDHIITLDEARLQVGLSPLSDEERETIVKELQMWRSPQNIGQNQQVPNEELSPEVKMQMNFDGFSTTQSLDKEVQKILSSVEPDVMEVLKKGKYFDKKEVDNIENN